MDTIEVAVHATDPITRAGLLGCLRDQDGLTITDSPESADVIVVATDRVESDVLIRMRQWNEVSSAPIVLVTGALREGDLLLVVECRVTAVLAPRQLSGDRLASAVKAAASGGGVLPTRLLGELLRHVENLHRNVLGPQTLTDSGLTPRGISVLRLMSHGMDTMEIAKELKYSERTVKNVIYTFTSRLKLRNRAHAVAFALRTGII
jgi:DNA-binding NarL/FixJ family response regulator